VAAATGHGDFGSYHERFGHDAETYRGYLDGAPKEKDHWKDCPVRDLLGGKEGPSTPLKIEIKGKKAPRWVAELLEAAMVETTERELKARGFEEVPERTGEFAPGRRRKNHKEQVKVATPASRARLFVQLG
jgi:hypothetical protein